MEEYRRWKAYQRRRGIAIITLKAVERYISTPEGKEKLDARIRAKKEKEENESNQDSI